MDDKKERFLARLRETFRVEAAEHIAAIASGLVQLEGASPKDAGPILEKAFREAHSLKGASRSVSLPLSEGICVELESIFAAMKRKELEPSPEAMDSIHASLSLLGDLCNRPGSAASPDDLQRQRRVVESLREVVSGNSQADEPDPEPAKAVPPPPPISRQAEPSPQPMPESSAVDGNASTTTQQRSFDTRTTVRVSTEKLSRLLLEAEELVGARIHAREHSDELRHFVEEFVRWNRKRTHCGSAMAQSAGGRNTNADGAADELLASKAMESSLRRLASEIRQDALSLSAITDRLLTDTKKLLLLPCSTLLGDFPVMVRNLSREQAKDAHLVVTGEDIEIDRRVLDELKDPFIHLLRNCIDHGLEKPEKRTEQGKS